MIGDAVLGVDDENDDVGVLDGLQGLDDGELLDGLEPFLRRPAVSTSS